jgi:uncharacterized membrane protein
VPVRKIARDKVPPVIQPYGASVLQASLDDTCEERLRTPLEHTS